MIARPKMSQNEWKSTEIITRFYKSWDIHVSPLSHQVPIVGKMLDSGCVTLDGIEFHGPKAEWPKFKM